MPVGFESINLDGIVQIGEGFKCLRLVSRGTLSLPTTHADSSLVKMGTLTVTNGVNPIVVTRFLSTSNHFGGVLGVSKSGSTFTFTIAGTAIPPSTSPPSSVDYWVYDSPVASSSGAGFEVYDAAGGIIFSTAWDILQPAVTLSSPTKYGAAYNSFMTYQENQITLESGQIDTEWFLTMYGVGCGPGTAAVYSRSVAGAYLPSSSSGPGLSGLNGPFGQGYMDNGFLIANVDRYY